MYMSSLEQFLHAFEKANSDEYAENMYEFELITNHSKEWHKEALEGYERCKFEQHKDFIKRSNWKNEILTGNEKWWLGITPIHFDLQGLSPKEYLIKAIVEELKGEPQEVNEIQEFGYEFNRSVSTLDYFFETVEGVYWLSFSVYD